MNNSDINDENSKQNDSAIIPPENEQNGISLSKEEEVQPVNSEQSIYSPAPVLSGTTVQLDRKRVPVIAVAAIAVVILALTGVLLYNFVPSVKNNAKLTVMSADDYYADVERNQAAKFSKEAYQLYKEYYDANTLNATAKDDSHSGTMVITAKEDFAKTYLQLDKEYSLTSNYDINIKDKKMELYMDLFVNKSKFFDLNSWADLEKGDIYASAPMYSDGTIHTTKDYLKTISETLSYGYSDSETAIKLDLTEETISKIADRYTDIYLKHAEDNRNTKINKKSAVTVSSVDAYYTEIDVEFSGDELGFLCKDMLTTMKTDKDLIKIYTDCGGTEQEYTDELTAALSELDDEMADKGFQDSSLEIYTYVNSNGEVVGRKVIVEDKDSGSITIEFMSAVNSNGDFGYTASYNDTETEEGFSFDVSGKCDKKTKAATGTAVLTIASNDYDYDTDKYSVVKTKVNASFEDLDVKDLKDGYLSGKITLTTDYEELKDCVMTAEFTRDGKTQKMLFDFLYQKKSAFSISITDTESDPTDVKMPDGDFYDIANEDEISKYVETIDLTKLEEAFRNEFSGIMTDEEINQLFATLNEELAYGTSGENSDY